MIESNTSATGYSIEVDSISEESWHSILDDFSDATIYQTWAFASVKAGDQHISHLIVKRDNEIVGGAQVRIARIPALRKNIAYVRWGPIWKRFGSETYLEDFQEIVTALRHEYVDRRNMYLRIIPYEPSTDNMRLRLILENSGYKWRMNPERTLLLPLDDPLETIKSNLGKYWRKNLVKAEKKGLKIISGQDSHLFDLAKQNYQEMLLRKKFDSQVDIDDYWKIQGKLPARHKMLVLVSLYDEKPIGSLVGSSIGSIGMELIAATNSIGLELGGSYLLRWKMVEYLKRCGCTYYNLNSINPIKNPGGYQFKKGLSGKKGLDVEYIGYFDACRNPIYHLCVSAFEMFSANNKLLVSLRR